MKNMLLIISILASCLLSVSCSDVDNPLYHLYDNEESGKQYVLVWQDEFNDPPNEDGSLSLPSDEWCLKQIIMVGATMNCKNTHIK